MHRRAVAVRRFGGERAAEGVNRGGGVAEPHPHLPEREPGRGKARRHLERLGIEIGRAGKVAAFFEVLGELETPVGRQIAGGNEVLHRGT